MNTPNPNVTANETLKVADTKLLEMIEYSLAKTEAEEKAVLAERPTRLRKILWLHRFQVLTWLMQQGVSLPVGIVSEIAHPQVGSQSVDAPVQQELDEQPKTKPKAKE